MKPIHLALSTFLLALTACQSPVKKTKEAATTPAPTKKADASGVVTTASGLRYKVLASGPASGRSPTRADSVMVHYRGTLVDGSVFDSSYDRGEPTTFGVAQVIPGWTEALQLMKPGDKWLLHIPSNLAYGAQGAGAKIPPFADLIFQVELLQIMGRL
jgi:FKBP-type peptidyl-prolyl cis-trans isomerase FklB